MDEIDGKPDCLKDDDQLIMDPEKEIIWKEKDENMPGSSSGPNNNDRDSEFWQLMRDCAKQKVKVHSYSYRHQQFYVVGDILLRGKAKTNLKKASRDGSGRYYDVGSVVQMCAALKTSTYGMYMKSLKPRFRSHLAIAESIFQQLKSYLLGKMEIRPSVIDPNGPMPLLKAVPPSVRRRVQRKVSSSTALSASVINEQMTIDDVEGEFFANPCYMEFFMNWLMHTNLTCVKNTRIIKLTEEQKDLLKTPNESCHHVSVTINQLPSTHFFGVGFGLDQKRAFWAASRSVVRRLYYAGFVTPILYHTIGKAGKWEFLKKMRRWRRMKEWKTVKSAVELFISEMTAKMPHWVQLTRDEINEEEFVRLTDEVLGSNRVIFRKRESKLNEAIRRKRKADDELEANFIESKRNKKNWESGGDAKGRNRERMTDTLNPLDMPSTSVMMISDSEMTENNCTNKKTWNVATKNAKTKIGNKEDTDDDECTIVGTVKGKTMFTIENRPDDSNVHENLAYYELDEENADVILEEDEDLPSVQLHAANTPSVLSTPTSGLESKYHSLCETLGVRCAEEALLVRNIIKEKRIAFPNEFKSFDEHIWKHFQINGQDDRTFSWKMAVRQKLLSLIRQVYKDSNLIAVGSTVNGCGSYNSDMDLCLCIPDTNNSYEESRSYGMHVLKKLHRRFVTDWREIIRKCHYIQAKVPIIKLEMAAPYEELEIDINCNNVAGIYNSHLLHYYSRIDDRFPALCLLVKHWAINAGINNAMMGTLNSYSLILMVLHFLQCGTMPPVLPNLQFLYPLLFNGTCCIYNLELFRDLPYPLPPREINMETVGELLIAFFDYYARFDFKKNAISISNGCIYGREQLAENTLRFKIFIEEPYDHKNTARCVTKFDNMQLIKQAFVSARNAFLRPRAGPPNLECIGVH